MAATRRSLAGRLLATYAVAMVLVVAVFGFVVERLAREVLLDGVESGLFQQAHTIARLLPEAADEVVPFVDQLEVTLNARITVVDVDGSVVADSHADPATMPNHTDRPEIQSAFRSAEGSDRRVSASTGFDQTYVAVLSPAGQVVRLSVPQGVVDSQVASFRRGLFLVVALVAIIGVALVALVARRLARPLTDLSDVAATMAAGNLAVSVPRSSIEEVDRVGRSLESMAQELGERIAQVDDERRTIEVVLEALPLGTLLIDDHDGILYASPSLLSLIGAVPSALDEVVPLRVQEAVRVARSNGTTQALELEHGRPARILTVVVSPFGDGRVLVVITDNTEQRRIEEVRRDFVTNASHELKTPVASILAAAESLQIAIERAPDRLAEFASRIEMSARSLGRLIGDLLDLSRLEGEASEHELVDLEGVVRAEVEKIRQVATERDIGLAVETTPITVMGSASDLALAVRNLLDNAIRYTDEGGTVTLRLRIIAGKGSLEVSDTGTGIPQRELGRVFERFYRVDEARSRKTGGTGLGLAIVRHVVEQHGGDVEVESELGVGTTFTVRLDAVV